MIIVNCPITNTNSEIMTPFVDSETDRYYKENQSYHTGVDIVCNKVYSVLSGVVIQVCLFDDHKRIVVQYNREYAVCYANMNEIFWEVGQSVQAGSEIGVADGFVHFELWLTTKGNSLWRTYVNNIAFYKHDPTEIATGETVFAQIIQYDTDDQYAIYGDGSTEEITDIHNLPPAMLQEFSNGRGDDDAEI